MASLYSDIKKDSVVKPSKKTNKIIMRYAMPFVLFGVVGFYIAMMIDFIPIHPLIVGVIAGGVAVFWRFVNTDDRKYRTGIEYGSAAWGRPSDIAPYLNPTLRKNAILSASEGLNMERPENITFDRNKNALVIGGSGTWKTTGFIIPNILQANASFCITDPKGEILEQTGRFLLKKGYCVKIFNMKDKHQSNSYNPFHYIRPHKAIDDIETLIDVIVENTDKGLDGKSTGKSSDPFWSHAEKSLLSALFCYVYFRIERKEQQNMQSIWELLKMIDVDEKNDKLVSPFDKLFADWELDEPDHYGVQCYHAYKKGAGKTLKSILIQTNTRIRKFINPDLLSMMLVDELELDRIGDRKTALFVILDDSNPTFNFMAAVMYTQLFNILLNKADSVYKGTLPYHVRFMLDEFANVGKIPYFNNLITTIRSRNISATIILQTLQQLHETYNDAADVIVAGCASVVFLGGQDLKTLEFIEKKLGQETIDIAESSTGTQSNTKNYRRMGRELMKVNELSAMDNKKCIVMIGGIKPFMSFKYDVTRHPDFEYTPRANDNFSWDMQQFLVPRTHMELALEPLPKSMIYNEVIKVIVNTTDDDGNGVQAERIDVGVPDTCVYVDVERAGQNVAGGYRKVWYNRDVVCLAEGEDTIFARLLLLRAMKIMIRRKVIPPVPSNYKKLSNADLWKDYPLPTNHTKIDVGIKGMHAIYMPDTNVIKIALEKDVSMYFFDLKPREDLALLRAKKFIEERRAEIRRKREKAKSGKKS